MIVKSVVNSQNSAWAAILAAWISILFVSLSVAAQDDAPSQPQSPPPPQQEAREKEFSFLMSQATLIGRYTSEPFETEEKKETIPALEVPQQSERYELGVVQKIGGDLWLFDTRITYGDHDIRLPLPLRVLWAGDTPVITLDATKVPGLGTFSARVMIHSDRYCGTWSAGDHGGMLSGRIERSQKTDTKNKEHKKVQPPTIKIK